MDKIQFEHPRVEGVNLLLIKDNMGNKAVFVPGVKIDPAIQQLTGISTEVKEFDYLYFLIEDEEDETIIKGQAEEMYVQNRLDIALSSRVSLFEPERYSVAYLIGCGLNESKFPYKGYWREQVNVSPEKKFLVVDRNQNLTASQIAEITDGYEYSLVIGNILQEG